MRNWLASNQLLDLEVVTAAVLSHHIKAAPEGDWKWCQPRGTRILRLFLQHDEVRATLERIRLVADLSGIPPLPIAPWTDKSPWFEAWQHGVKTATRLSQNLRRDKNRRSMLLIVKAGVIIADAASSGLVRESHPESIGGPLRICIHTTFREIRSRRVRKPHYGSRSKLTQCFSGPSSADHRNRVPVSSC